MHSWFITGTDTDVGKTYVGNLLMQSLKVRGITALGYKPVSAGCDQVNGELVNDDAKQYQQNSAFSVTLSEVNPVAFVPPIAPHIAAAKAEQTITLEQLKAGYDHLATYKPQVLITEGAGGWQLPLGNQCYMPELPKTCEMQAILVVGLRLGCLNHALLTARAIEQDGVKLMGWIGNDLSDDMPYLQENIRTLTDELGEPLALVPFMQNWDKNALATLTQKMI